MKIKTVWQVYFSCTGTTKSVVTTIAGRLAEALGAGLDTVDFTLPAARQGQYCFGEGDLVVFGCPTYAGRLPNLIMPFVRDGFVGGGALGVPVALYGNRNFDDSLMELRNLMEANGFHTVAGGAFVGEHSFSTTLGAGRPDGEDLAAAAGFAAAIAKEVEALETAPTQPVAVEGCDPIRPYYKPQDRHGNPINILKVKPKTTDACDNCGKCAAVCPMGAISAEDCKAVPGICIKCGACVKGCPKGAKYYDDAGFLYHQHELEDVYQRRGPIKMFLLSGEYC